MTGDERQLQENARWKKSLSLINRRVRQSMRYANYALDQHLRQSAIYNPFRHSTLVHKVGKDPPPPFALPRDIAAILHQKKKNQSTIPLQLPPLPQPRVLTPFLVSLRQNFQQPYYLPRKKKKNLSPFSKPPPPPANSLTNTKKTSHDPPPI